MPDQCCTLFVVIREPFGYGSTNLIGVYTTKNKAEAASKSYVAAKWGDISGWESGDEPNCFLMSYDYESRIFIYESEVE